MSNVTQITDHIDAAKARLIQQYKGKANIEALLSSLSSEQIQDLEDVLFQLYPRLSVDLSEGVQLDGIGKIVGLARDGRTDSTYRVFLNAVIGRNVSEGDIERVISVWKLLTQASVVQVIENFPAEIELQADTVLSDAEAAVALPLMQDTVGAGIKVLSVVVDPSEAFGFDGSVGTLGFDSVVSTGANTSTSAFRLIDTTANFVGDGVLAGYEAVEIAGNATALVLSVDSGIQLTLDTDIFVAFPLDYDIIKGVGGKLAHIQ